MSNVFTWGDLYNRIHTTFTEEQFDSPCEALVTVGKTPPKVYPVEGLLEAADPQFIVIVP